MMFQSSLLLFLASIGTVSGHVARKHQARGDRPRFSYDPNSSQYCSYWIDNVDSSLQCTQVPAQWDIPLSSFLRWNPSLAPNCENFVINRSYCVEVEGEPAVTVPATTTAGTTPSPTITPSPTGNGIATPLPTQPSMVNNCDAFYFVPKDTYCDTIASLHGITTSQLVSWNPSIGSGCGGLWAEVYVCVSIIGHTPTISSAKPTSTKPSNGISTPLPTQPSIVDNCDAFYFVPRDEGCASVASKHGISLTQFTAWNPSVGSTCSGLWADAYACVSIIGHTPTPVQPGNGVQTPSPIQSGMVTNCKTFHFVVKDETCATITAKYRISQNDFIRWNPAVGSGCRGMWADTYACVAVLS